MHFLFGFLDPSLIPLALLGIGPNAVERGPRYPDHIFVLASPLIDEYEPVVWTCSIELCGNRLLVELDSLIDSADLLEVLAPEKVSNDLVRRR